MRIAYATHVVGRAIFTKRYLDYVSAVKRLRKTALSCEQKPCILNNFSTFLALLEYLEGLSFQVSWSSVLVAALATSITSIDGIGISFFRNFVAYRKLPKTHPRKKHNWNYLAMSVSIPITAVHLLGTLSFMGLRTSMQSKSFCVYHKNLRIFCSNK